MFQQCDILYYNGRVYTMDDRNTIAEALAVKGDRIVGVGATWWLKLRFHPHEMVDLNGKTVLPAFIDAHAHLLDLGLARLTVNLEQTRSTEEVVRCIKEFLEKNPIQGWIRGRGWDQNLWVEKRFPNRQILDAISSEHPMYFVRIDGHACWVNSMAMNLAGITKATPDPPGGKILRDEHGAPIGIFLDKAMELIQRHLPPPTEEEMRVALQKATEECLSYGIATVHDMAIDKQQFELYKQLVDERKLSLRVYGAIDGESDLWAEMLLKGPLLSYGDNRLVVRAVKYFLDGALGSRGAALFEPYTDDPTNRGITTMSAEELRTRVKNAVEHGFQVCIHAIGDRANSLALDAYEKVLATQKENDKRLRIEHAQIVQEKDVERFARFKIIASIQPVQYTSDGTWAETRLGYDRMRLAYRWRSFLDAGVNVAGGSDFPIESPDPLRGITAACTRNNNSSYVASTVTFDNNSANERMTREEAIRCFTTAAAYVGFQEDCKGSLQKGYLADFVILSDDIFTISPEKLTSLYVEKTIVGGKVAYDRMNSSQR